MIPYPKKRSEFEIQATLYNCILELGMDVRGEVKIPKADYGGTGKPRGCRFDLVVYKQQQAVCIIEAKNSVRRTRPKMDSPQYRRYLSFKLPLLYCYNMNQIKEVVDQVKELHIAKK